MKTDFIQMLAEVQAGEALQLINARLTETVQAVCETGTKAVLTLKVEIAPRKKEMGGAVSMVDVEFKTDVKRAQIQPAGAIFFVDADGELSRDHPGQTAMFESMEVKNG